MTAATLLAGLTTILSQAAAPPVGPPRDAALIGRVVHATAGTPVAGAAVTLADLDWQTLTDPDGRFAFAAVPDGRHTLTVSMVGFAFVRRDVTIVGSTPTVLDVPLVEGPGGYREDVTVSAMDLGARAPGVAAARDASAATLQDLRGIAADDPMRAVQALPGVVTGDDFQAEFSVRGSAFRHLGVVIDGIAAPTLLHAVRGADDTGSVAMLNTDVLSHATLLAGAHPRRRGDWLGATLDFDVREGSRDRVGARAAVSGTSASTVVEGPIGRDGRGSWLVSGRKSYIDWLIRKVEPDIDSTIGFADGLAKVVFDLTPGQQIQVLVTGGDAVYRERETSQANGLFRATSGSTLAAASWRLAAGRTILAQRLTFHASDFRNQGPVGQQLGRGYEQAVGWQGEAMRALGRGWSIESGLAWRTERMNQILREFTSVRPGVVRVRATREVSAQFTNRGAWAHVTRTSASGMVSAGARVSSQAIAPERVVVSPWIVAERHIGRTTWRAGAGRSAQFADPALVGVEGPVVPTERATDVGLGVEHGVSPAWRWSAAVFGRRDDALRRRVGEPRLDARDGSRIAAELFPLHRSSIEATTRGVDLLVSRRADAGPTGWISYTWAHTRARDTVTGEAFDGDLDQRHTLNVFVQQRLSYRLSVNARLRVGSNVPVVGYFEPAAGDGLRLSVARNQVRLPTYARLDLRGTRTFEAGRRRVTLFVEVMNALGRRNVRQSEASVRPTLEVLSYAERLVPLVPSAGVVIEF